MISYLLTDTFGFELTILSNQLYKIKKLTFVSLFLNMEDPVGFEPTIRELQSRALPLGYESGYVLNYIKINKNIQYNLC